MYRRLYHPSQSVGQPIDGKSTGRHHDSAAATQAQPTPQASPLTVAVANRVVRRALVGDPA